MALKMKLKLNTYQIGSPRKRGQGIRIGTVRYLPRGVFKKDYVRHDYFDVWFPVLAPSRKLMTWAKQQDLSGVWQKFAEKYVREMMMQTESRQSLFLIAKLAEKTPVSIGCYCADETCCHRSLLFGLIQGAANNKLG